MHIEHITIEDGDWVVLKVDDKEYYSGHSIPDFVWMTLLHTVSEHSITTSWMTLLHTVPEHSITTSCKEISSEDMEEGNY